MKCRHRRRKCPGKEKRACIPQLRRFRRSSPPAMHSTQRIPRNEVPRGLSHLADLSRLNASRGHLNADQSV
jgi:hypothetical protein